MFAALYDFTNADTLSSLIHDSEIVHVVIYVMNRNLTTNFPLPPQDFERLLDHDCATAKRPPVVGTASLRSLHLAILEPISVAGWPGYCAFGVYAINTGTHPVRPTAHGSPSHDAYTSHPQHRAFLSNISAASQRWRDRVPASHAPPLARCCLARQPHLGVNARLCW